METPNADLEKADKVRKYTNKQRVSVLDEQKAVLDTFDSLIPDNDRLENLKNRFDLMQDIFDHTRNRTKTNQKRIVTVFNRHPWKYLDLIDPAVQRVTQKDISFPD